MGSLTMAISWMVKSWCRACRSSPPCSTPGRACLGDVQCFFFWWQLGDFCCDAFVARTASSVLQLAVEVGDGCSLVQFLLLAWFVATTRTVLRGGGGDDVVLQLLQHSSSSCPEPASLGTTRSKWRDEARCG